MVSRAIIRLWGRDIGAVVWDDRRDLGVFQYAPDFLQSGIQISPIEVPLRPGPFDFPGLARASFKGLPGFLADSLPDKFGNALIDAWLTRQGRAPGSMNPVERLCYTGTRGMGALEYHPDTQGRRKPDVPIDIANMVDLASTILTQRQNLHGTLDGQHDQTTLTDILRIGTSAGGARAKAVLAWHETTGEFRSGQVQTDPAFTYWLMKFDGVVDNKDKELADPQGFGRIEYACALVAKAAGVTMARCRLHHEGGRAHFMTERFDRLPGGDKLHMLTLGGMRHFDFNQPRAHSYEQAIETLRRLRAPTEDIEEQLRRAYLNILLRNQDDHVKNIAYLMDKRGTWRLSPAYDVCYAYNPSGAWTAQHQMTLAGKAEGFTLDDLMELARFADVKPVRAKRFFDQAHAAVSDWATHAMAAGVFDPHIAMVQKGLRLTGWAEITR